MKKLLTLLLCHVTCTLSANSVFESMSDAEKKACGIEKLSSDEKTALQTWFAAKTALKSQAAVGDKIEHGSFTITEVIELGHYVKLDNGLSYDIYSRSRKKTMAWKVGDTIELVEPVKRKSYKLTNKSKKQTVAAKEAL